MTAAGHMYVHTYVHTYVVDILQPYNNALMFRASKNNLLNRLSPTEQAVV